MAVAPLTDKRSGSGQGCQWRLGEPLILTIDSNSGFCYGCLCWNWECNGNVGFFVRNGSNYPLHPN